MGSQKLWRTTVTYLIVLGLAISPVMDLFVVLPLPASLSTAEAKGGVECESPTIYKKSDDPDDIKNFYNDWKPNLQAIGKDAVQTSDNKKYTINLSWQRPKAFDSGCNEVIIESFFVVDTQQRLDVLDKYEVEVSQGGKIIKTAEVSRISTSQLPSEEKYSVDLNIAEGQAPADYTFKVRARYINTYYRHRITWHWLSWKPINPPEEVFNEEGVRNSLYTEKTVTLPPDANAEVGEMAPRNLVAKGEYDQTAKKGKVELSWTAPSKGAPTDSNPYAPKKKSNNNWIDPGNLKKCAGLSYDRGYELSGQGGGCALDDPAISNLAAGKSVTLTYTVGARWKSGSTATTHNSVTRTVTFTADKDGEVTVEEGEEAGEPPSDTETNPAGGGVGFEFEGGCRNIKKSEDGPMADIWNESVCFMVTAVSRALGWFTCVAVGYVIDPILNIGAKLCTVPDFDKRTESGETSASPSASATETAATPSPSASKPTKPPPTATLEPD